MELKREGHENDSGKLTGLAGKYLTFALENENYGVSILKVREIIGIMEITAVPHTPHYFKGVINLRGRVIPVMDLRLKFDMEDKEYNERTCIIVVEVPTSSGAVQVGALVDSVSEVLNVGEDDIEPPPAFGNSMADSAILGMAKVKGDVTILLDVDQIIGSALPEEMLES